MRLGEATSNRTRATMRITWLLLSLSFLLHSVSPDNTDQPQDTNRDAASVATITTVATPTENKSNTTIQKNTPDATTPKNTPDAITAKNTSDATTPKNTPDETPTKNTPGATAPKNTPDATIPKNTRDATNPKNTLDATTPKNTRDATNPKNTPDATNPKNTPDTTNTVITRPTTIAKVSRATITTPTPGSPVKPSDFPDKVQTNENSYTPTGSPHHTKTTKISDVKTVNNSTTSKINKGDHTRTMSPMTTTSATITEPQPKKLQYSLNSRHEEDHDKELVEVCKRLMVHFQDGNCTLSWRQLDDKVQFDHVEINGKVKTNLAAQYYEEISKKKATDNKTLIAILASCGALLIMIVILAVCASHHRKPYNENQQHLTDELHTVENGYHDNPTLEVMEVQPEMQEKRMVLNGEFNDSWIVPMDNLLKEDIPEEEDTHL